MRAPARFECRAREALAMAAEDCDPRLAAVPAFRELAAALAQHANAPTSLVRRSRRAAADEVRHARILVSLAAREEGRAGARVIVRDVKGDRTLEALAAHNAAEGCVREAHAALVAGWQAESATSSAFAGR